MRAGFGLALPGPTRQPSTQPRNNLFPLPLAWELVSPTEAVAVIVADAAGDPVVVVTAAAAGGSVVVVVAAAAAATCVGALVCF